MGLGREVDTSVGGELPHFVQACRCGRQILRNVGQLQLVDRFKAPDVVDEKDRLGLHPDRVQDDRRAEVSWQKRVKLFRRHQPLELRTFLDPTNHPERVEHSFS